MEIERLWQRRWFRGVVILGVWTLFGGFVASQLFIAYTRSSIPIQWYRLVLLETAHAYVWAALTPVILWLGHRFRIERGTWQRNLAIHLFASLLVGFSTRILHDLVFYYLIYSRERPLSLIKLLSNVYLIFDYGVLIYWLILLVSYAFGYYHRYREGERKASTLEVQLAQAELRALKMQLHPHFLFNTLHSISALLYKDITAADKMIARLGDFLRITLENSGTQEVSLQQELEFLKSYLEIERIRFQDRLTVNMEIEPETLNARLPNLILQPLVENAIRHGIAPRSSEGRIAIAARRLDGFLQVQVFDNGPGIPTNGTSSSLYKEGVGLSNTQARLQQIYGSLHRLDLENAPTGGLTVTLEIPFK